MTKTVGLVLLWLGFLGAALVTVIQPEGDFLWTASPTEPKLGAPVWGVIRDAATNRDVSVQGVLTHCDDLSATLEMTERDPQTNKAQSVSRTIQRGDARWLRTKVSDRPWSKIDWPWYALAAGIGWLGVVVLRRAKAAERVSRRDAEAGNLNQLVEQLGRAAAGVSSLAERIDSLTCEEVLDEIDHRLAPQLTAFADERQMLADRLGTAAFSRIMTEFASGERYLNRAWSAAADGYVDEVVAAVNHARNFLDEAQRLAKEFVAN